MQPKRMKETFQTVHTDKHTEGHSKVEREDEEHLIYNIFTPTSPE